MARRWTCNNRWYELARRWTGKPVKVDWLKLRHVVFQKPNTTDIVMLYKYDLTVPFQAAVIGHLPQQTRRSATSHIIPPVQSEHILPVSKALKKGLIDLCNENAIRPDHHQYFHSLPTCDDIADEDDDIDPNRDSDTEPEA